jgi:hypothetical protein
VWTDEAVMHLGGFQQTYVTCKPDEKFNMDCLRPKFANIPHTMIWACFAGTEKGPLILWDKKNGVTYPPSPSSNTSIYPTLLNWWASYNANFSYHSPEVMQDGASLHRAKATMACPACSPDLNPIKSF